MRRGLRAAGWALAGLFGVALLAILATNVLLKTSLLRRLVNAKPDALTVEYRGAASWLPGHLSFESVTLRSRDRNVEFEAVLGDVELRVSLADLVRRRFHTTRLRAGTLRFRLRERLTRQEATAARLGRYPRIAGFADPPLVSASSSARAAGPLPWRVVIDDLAVARVEEIWIDSWKWSGNGRVAGSFELLPGREARVGPARLEVSSGALRRGDAQVANRTRGAVWCELPRYAPKTHPGNEVWKILSGGSDLRADLAGLEFLSPDSGGADMSGGVGSILAQVELKHGAGGVRVSATARDATLRTRKRTFKGTVKLDLLAPMVDFPRGEASLAGTKVVLSDVAVKGAPGRPWSATFLAPKARLRLGDGSLDGGLAGSLLDARPIVALMPPGLPRWIAKVLDLENLEVSGHVAAGPSRFALTSLRLFAGDFSLAGDYRSSSGEAHGAFRATKGGFSIDFTVPSGD